jgi:hypothetical protein
MKLVKNKLFKHADKEYLIDVTKDYDAFSSFACGKDYWTYGVSIYNPIKRKGILGLIFKHELLFFYRTDWIKYYDYNGDIDKIMKKVISEYERTLREQKYISEKEKEWSDD